MWCLLQSVCVCWNRAVRTVNEQYAPLLEGTVELIVKCYATVHYAKLLDSAAQVRNGQLCLCTSLSACYFPHFTHHTPLTPYTHIIHPSHHTPLTPYTPSCTHHTSLTSYIPHIIHPSHHTPHTIHPSHHTPHPKVSRSTREGVVVFQHNFCSSATATFSLSPPLPVRYMVRSI